MHAVQVPANGGRRSRGARFAFLVLLTLLALAMTACTRGRGGGGGGGDDDDSGSDDDDDDATGDDDDDDSTAGPCQPEGATTCNGIDFMECQDSAWTLVQQCLDPTPVCHPEEGCLACSPGVFSCDGNDIVVCDDNGLGNTFVETCPESTPCVGGICQDPCAVAASQYSYLGCDFVAASTANIVSTTFDNDFAVVVGNPESSPGPAQVTVSRGGVPQTSATVQAGDTAAITLRMVQELKGATQSLIATDAAYEIHSTLPIAAYQYNPLNFELSFDNSFTNDASLLLPEHTLTGQYMISHWPTFGVGSGMGSSVSWFAFQPGFFAVVGVNDNTQVTIDFNGRTAPGTPGQMEAGDSTTISLNRGDVAQIMSYYDAAPSASSYSSNQGRQQATGTALGAEYTYCLGTNTDLTGTTISATNAVAVFAGHQCSFVPFDAWACDHLEEMMFPTATWGTMSVMTAPIMPGGSGLAPTKYRIVALENNTSLTFDPAVTSAPTLNAGDFYEFETDSSFVVTGSSRIYVTQTMLGQDELGTAIGDPAMGSGIPWLQVRNEYDFLTPSTFTENWVNVVAPAGQGLLDGSPVSGFQAIGSTGYEVARVSLSAGGHHMESGDGSGFGITTYGYAEYTSYLYPGGLNFLR